MTYVGSGFVERIPVLAFFGKYDTSVSQIKVGAYFGQNIGSVKIVTKKG